MQNIITFRRKTHISVGLSVLLLLNFLLPQDIFSEQTRRKGPENLQSYQLSSQRYITDEMGNILMYVNIWGHVNKPGSHLVFDGIDMATLISVVGGPKKGADLKRVRLFRETPDDNGKTAYEIDLDQFFKTGDRSNFVEIKPNDTLIFPQSTYSYIIANVGTMNTFMSMINLYFTINYYRTRSN
ncbi:MAG: hypothetical protein ACE5D7_08685 [Fidelibacterota bacterium]